MELLPWQWGGFPISHSYLRGLCQLHVKYYDMQDNHLFKIEPNSSDLSYQFPESIYYVYEIMHVTTSNWASFWTQKSWDQHGTCHNVSSPFFSLGLYPTARITRGDTCPMVPWFWLQMELHLQILLLVSYICILTITTRHIFNLGPPLRNHTIRQYIITYARLFLTIWFYICLRL